jgi:hypothetical protein
MQHFTNRLNMASCTEILKRTSAKRGVIAGPTGRASSINRLSTWTSRIRATINHSRLLLGIWWELHAPRSLYTVGAGVVWQTTMMLFLGRFPSPGPASRVEQASKHVYERAATQLSGRRSSQGCIENCDQSRNARRSINIIGCPKGGRTSC